MFPNFAIPLFTYLLWYLRLDHCDHAPTSTSTESGRNSIRNVSFVET